ncbi:hypothetical protein V9L05_20515 [Bernardetia sp. Wsw4-3y2]|uniref:hypothetical protein n=1 Tax=Bernardetia sp. Wsw4-3y2 TaxID=3127471 RepID=UPI0030D3E437
MKNLILDNYIYVLIIAFLFGLFIGIKILQKTLAKNAKEHKPNNSETRKSKEDDKSDSS